MTQCGNSGIKAVYNYEKIDFGNTKWSKNITENTSSGLLVS